MKRAPKMTANRALSALLRTCLAVVETFFETIKSELVWRTVLYTRAEAGQAIARYMDGFHNPVRRHSALGHISPVEFERTASC